MDLKEFFEKNKKVALAFSGGVDSSYLLYYALKSGARVKAYYVKSNFQPEFEFKDAKKMAEDLKADLKIIYVDVLQKEKIKENPWNRCYFCKETIFSTILREAKADGFQVLLDGTNASDSFDDRPGMKAKEELKVLSPLYMAGLTKSDVRRLSKEAGLFTWDKPSYSCLATRIKEDMEITIEDLKATEDAEDFLFGLGFKDFRVRRVESGAKLQVKGPDFEKVFKHREEILNKLQPHYGEVLLDLKERQ